SCGAPGVLVRWRRFGAISQPGKDVRGHVLGVGDRRRGRRVRARGFEPVSGMARIVVDMNQVVEDTRVVRILRVDLLEELCRESLPLEALTAFLDRCQKRYPMNKFG